MHKYLMGHLAAASEGGRDNGWLLALLAAIWNEAQQRYSGFFMSDPVWLVTACWAVDFLLGTILALRDSWRGGPNRWSPACCARSLGKWLLWMTVLFVTFNLRKAGGFGFGPFASLLESAIVLSEVTSAIRNAGKLNGARWLERFAAAGEHGVERIAERVEATMGEPHPNGPVSPAAAAEKKL